MEPGTPKEERDAGAPAAAVPNPITADAANTTNQPRRHTNPETPTMTAAPD
jgi:hypothetical protein